MAAGILRAPQVSVQVAEYRSGVVAVMGSVERPGLYPVTRPATIADLIWAAGGPSKDAGRVVEFVRRDPDGTRPRRSVGGGGDAPSHRPAVGPQPSVAASDPEAHAPPPSGAISNACCRAGRTDCGLDPQVRPGDVISVAPAGSVQVAGWVEKPGSYPVTRGLTLAGAIAAAGGNLFPADRRTVTVTRILGRRAAAVRGRPRRGRDGHVADVPITDGDVVHLPSATERLVPWGVWTVAREMVHVGGSVLLF